MNKTSLDENEINIISKYKKKEEYFMAIIYYGAILGIVCNNMISINNINSILILLSVSVYILIILKYIYFKCKMKKRIIKEISELSFRNKY